MRKLITLVMMALLVQLGSAQESEPESSGIRTSVGVGAVTMDGETWQMIALRPDIPIGKFGVGLDLTFYFDSEGNLREDDWNEAADVIDKIYYVRYGRKGDPFYVKAGALDNVTLGFGILMKYYTNSIEWPDVKRVGLEFDIRRQPLQLEGMFNNFRELGEPGLFGVRASYAFLGKLRLGGGMVMDGNQFASYHDDDDDGVPDELDLHPEYDDQNVVNGHDHFHNLDPVYYEDHWQELGLTDPDLLDNPVPDYSDKKEPVTAFQVDVSYPLLGTKVVLYGQAAQFLDYGFGFAAPGVRFQPFSMLTMSAEYRDYGDEFIPEYFGRTYELERYTTGIDAAGDLTLVPGSRRLEYAKAASGIYADANLNVFNFVTLFAAYSTMKLKDPGEFDPDQYDSFYGKASVNVSKIPKLADLSAYYQQSNVENLFDLFTESTVYGYQIGYEVSPGVNVMFNYRFTFRDLNGDGEIHGTNERIKTFYLATQFGI